MKIANHNPDVLTCLANLSNDEVFTPPDVVNRMLDLLPGELWHDPKTTFLDPACKSGVFLREIAKRLMAGLAKEIPDAQERANHIFTKQLYGIAITELTGLLLRRSVYCSKKANGKYSVCTAFDDEHGNICYTPMQHTWEKGRCVFCGANEEIYERGEEMESHAYQFIHTTNPEKIFNMRFDVIIGNPPYQLSDGGAQASARPIYQLFVEQAKKLNPRYLVMIIPARWYAGGKGLDEFRDNMLHDRRIKEIHDFINSYDCFSALGQYGIKGGICYFLWDKEYKGDCLFNSYKGEKKTSCMKRPLLEKDANTLIRYNEAIPILRKIQGYKEETFDSIISARKPFGFPTNYTDFSASEIANGVRIYAQQRTGYVAKNKIKLHPEWINKYKLFIPEAIGSGDFSKDWVKPVIGNKDTCCTETYLVCGPFNEKTTRDNAFTYSQTKFFHFLLGLKKITQHTTRAVYSFIPLQDFSEPWTDEKLYKKYNLAAEEIAFIESMIRPMD